MDKFIHNDVEYDTLKDALDAAQDGDIIFCNFDIFDTQKSLDDCKEENYELKE